MKKHDVLFQTIKLKNVEVKNRIGMAPMNVSMSGQEHSVSEQNIAYYAARAAGGTGLIMIEAVGGTNHPTARTYEHHNNMQLWFPWQVGQHSELVETIHSFGAKVIVQLSVGAGRQGSSHFAPDKPVAPSPIPWEPQWDMMPRGLQLEDMTKIFELEGGESGMIPETPREITVKEIKELVADITKATRLARIAGYDGVELHAPHGYLLAEFLSPRSNKRTDEYGGSMENRARFVCDCLRGMRAAAGPDYLLTVRMSADEHQPDGQHVEDTIQYAVMAAEAGADALHLSDGCFESLKYFIPDEDGQIVEESAQIKKGIQDALGREYPVMCPSVHNPDLAAKSIKAGKMDIVTLGRALIADPEWTNKVREGRVKDIVKCLRCNKCLQRFFLSLPCRCMVNPEMGQERYLEKYKRPVLPLKKRVWKIPKEI